LQCLARKIGIDTPQNYLTYEDARVPFVIKPIDKSSAKGVRYFKSDKSKNAFSLTQDKKVIIQEYIQGFGCGYSVFVKEGVIKVGYGHKRLAEFPVSGGSSVYRATFFDPRMKSIADKIFQEVQWSGFAMIEFKYTPDNRLVLIEVNPRIWGSVNQGLQCGINYFEPIFGHGKLNYQQKEINTYLSPQIYTSLIQYLMKLNFKPLSKFISSIRKNKGDLSLMNDPKGFLSVIARKVLK
jgi:predicted ATP-grasp superfamily ATP-dependent carboligase